MSDATDNAALARSFLVWVPLDALPTLRALNADNGKRQALSDGSYVRNLIFSEAQRRSIVGVPLEEYMAKLIADTQDDSPRRGRQAKAQGPRGKTRKTKIIKRERLPRERLEEPAAKPARVRLDPPKPTRIRL